MKLVVATSFLALFSGNVDASVRRQLSQENFGVFTPITQVTDHAAIALDQAQIVSLLDSYDFGGAQEVYENGANSKSVAALRLSTQLTTSFPAKTEVTGVDTEGNPVTGKVYVDANSGDDLLQVQYATTDSISNHVGCRVGGSSTPMTAGCFAETGTVSVNQADYAYSYSVEVGNFNARSIQGFSTSTNKHRQFGDAKNDYYQDFGAFVDYYGSETYADDIISAALTGTNAGLSQGNLNFFNAADDARVQGTKKGTAYLSIFMYVIRELEDALDDCDNECAKDDCNDDAVHALDEAVAFYSGTLLGAGSDGNGNLLYALAEKRCINFGTCGVSGEAAVNEQVFVQFRSMQDNLLKGSCKAARSNKERIVDLMYVPMVQGALRYSYFQGYGLDDSEKAKAEGALFAAAVLPKVNKCSPRDAEVIYSNLNIGNSGDVDHDQVKRSFERNYGCMGITCADVGGLTDGEDYFEGAEPCASSSRALNILGVTLGMMGVALSLLM